MKKLFIIAGVSIALTACGSKNPTQATDAHDHEHETAEHVHDEACQHHDHNISVVGVAQEGDASSGKITIVKINDGQTATFDYTTSNPDKIAAWIAGDTVTVFIDHHHHGEHHHDSITAIKIGAHQCSGHEHNHDHAHEHSEDCNHQH